MKRCLAALLLLVLAGIGRAQAQTCTAAGTAAAFGTYAPLGGAVSTTAATVTIVCNPGVISVLVSYTIALSAGTGGSFAARSLAGPTSTRLGYQLYRDLGYSQIWGDGSGGTYTVTDGYTLGLILPITKMYTAYGRIPAGQNVPIGAYADTITVTLSY